MGFFDFEQVAKTSVGSGPSLKLLHKMQCKTCPLNNQIGLGHPDMAPTGSSKPLVYILGEAPGADEDRVGRQFVGDSGQVLKFRIPEEYKKKIRWNNVVRTRPPNNETPNYLAVESCRPSVIKDIEATKPKAIFGFGNIPLNWMIEQSGITRWRGRRIPVKIGNHSCWFFPMLHPSFILRKRKTKPRNVDQYGSEDEFAFALDLKNAFSIVEDLPEPIVHSDEKAMEGISIITGENGDRDVSKIIKFIQSLHDEKIVGLDYETNGLRPYNEDMKILTVGLSVRDKAVSFPLNHSQSIWTDKQLKKINYYFKKFLREAKCKKVAHNLAFELEWTGTFYGVDTIRSGKWGDSISQAYIIDERQGCLSLEALCLQYFGVNIKKLNNLDRKRLDKTKLSDVLVYNAMDAKYHRLLYLKQVVRLKEDSLKSIYDLHVRRVATMVLTQMEGVPVDQKVVNKFRRKYEKRLGAIHSKIMKMDAVKKFEKRKGFEFNPASPHHVGYIVRQVLHKPVDDTTEHTLKAVKHPLTNYILKYRHWNKLLSTYVKPLVKGSPDLYFDGMLHPIITTVKTDTGRTSSNNPNIQNFPSRSDKEVRSQIRVLPGNVIVSIDYAQIQARNVAMESGDKALVEAFWNRYDIHADWVEKIVKKYPKWIKEGVKALNDKDVFKHYRNRAKNQMVFPSFFGAQHKKISRELEIPEHTALYLHEQFWDMFPDIKGWHERLFDEYKQTGYVTGLSGYRRRAPISPNQLINAPIQADEALIVTDAQNRLSELDHKKYQAMLMVHDDLTFKMKYKDLEKRLEVIIPEMIDVPFEWAHVVPIGVEVAVGEDWYNLKPIGDYFSDQYEPGMIDIGG